MNKVVDGRIVQMTPEEVREIEDTHKRYEAQERHRPLTLEEVNELLIKKQVNTVVIDDQTSLRMKYYYPSFDELIGEKVKKDFKFIYKDKLYKVIQPELTFQAHYLPGQGTESLYARIDETHAGDIYDPIPYEGNMALVNGKYYSQNGVVYLCNRDTGNPVYHALKDLVGQYVQVVA